MKNEKAVPEEVGEGLVFQVHSIYQFKIPLAMSSHPTYWANPNLFGKLAAIPFYI